MSALSTAYTVKSLPGAMLYIPVDSDYNNPVSLKRSLSDPEIYFPSAVRHSLIVAVNGIVPNKDKPASPHVTTARVNGEPRCPGRRPASLRARPTGRRAVMGEIRPAATLAIPGSKSGDPAGQESNLQININVIQPTPNISPSCSIRSISGESKDLGIDPPANPQPDTLAGIPFLVVPPSPVKVSCRAKCRIFSRDTLLVWSGT